MARTGKIARLSAIIREQLNRRMLNGEAAKPLLEWLNGLEEVQDTMKCYFKVCRVSEQNLTRCVRQDWLRLEESCNFLEDLGEEAEGYFTATDERPVGELIVARAAVELAKVAQALMAARATEPKERWRILKELLPHLAQLRRADHRAVRLEIQKERHEWEETEHYRKEARREFLENQQLEEIRSRTARREGENQTKSK